MKLEIGTTEIEPANRAFAFHSPIAISMDMVAEPFTVRGHQGLGSNAVAT